ncbi:MAG: NifU family protein [Bacteroidetes bacterium]|nr:NifU family protein [Bacteroidota bacterium]MBU1423093.1 NifU family protein [Bacteroidota bacterium]MBU2471538.1 NifU family protein [Bacteroidota bacterium]
MDKTTQESILNRVKQALEFCRPYLKADGGDVELVRITEDGIVELSFKGMCVGCPMAMMTLRAGIERTILHYAPEIKRVELVG